LSDLKSKVAVAGLVITIITAVYFPIAQFNKWPPFTPEAPPVTVQYQSVLQDVHLNDESYSNPTLDLTILNNGSKSLIFTEAVLTVNKIWKITPVYDEDYLESLRGMSAQPLKVSADYYVKLTISDQNECTVVNHNISQLLAPDEIDRFTIKLSNDVGGRSESLYVLQMDVELIQGDGGSLVIPNLIFFANPDSLCAGLHDPSNVDFDTDQINSIAQEIENTEGTKTDRVIQLTEAILQD
jgi:hypothetical protein